VSDTWLVRLQRMKYPWDSFSNHLQPDNMSGWVFGPLWGASWPCPCALPSSCCLLPWSWVGWVCLVVFSLAWFLPLAMKFHLICFKQKQKNKHRMEYYRKISSPIEIMKRPMHVRKPGENILWVHNWLSHLMRTEPLRCTFHEKLMSMQVPRHTTNTQVGHSNISLSERGRLWVIGYEGEDFNWRVHRQ